MSPFTLERDLDQLQSNIALGRSVLVLGPGCQRVGFDAADSSGWREVRRRLRLLGGVIDPDLIEQRKFLEGFWRSKMSDEVKRGQPDPQSTAHHPWLSEQLTLFPGQPDVVVAEGKLSAVDKARILWLGRPLLDLFALGTARLGAVVSEGLTPVIDWYDVNDLRLRGVTELDAEDQDPAVDPDTEPERVEKKEIPGVEVLGELVDRLETAATLLSDWTKDPVAGELSSPLLPSITVKKAETKALLAFIRAAQMVSLPHCARAFKKHCVSGAEAQLTGANVEWLGDLLWNVLTCDADVPPAQSEVAFHINLPFDEGRITPSDFVRARPGEYRYAPLDDRQHNRDKILLAFLRNRTRARNVENPLAAGPLRDVYRTLAASMAQQTRKKADDRRPLALVAGYDLTLETELLKMLKPEQRMHVVVPVRLHGPGVLPIIDWLLVTITRPAEVYADSLSTAEREVAWLRHSRGRVLNEPVILRVAGAPFLSLSDEKPNTNGGVKLSSLGIGRRDGSVEEDEYDDFDDEESDLEVRPVLVFEEYEASIVFRELSKGMPAWLATSLSWTQRGWTFLGEGFPEWIPRLRLIFTSSLGGTPPATERPSELNALMAVDRRFSWPEASLLAALGIDSYKGDLHSLRFLATSVPEDDQTGQITEFFRQVDIMVKRQNEEDEADENEDQE